MNYTKNTIKRTTSINFNKLYSFYGNIKKIQNYNMKKRMHYMYIQKNKKTPSQCNIA